MATLVEAEVFLQALKIGLAKVKEAQASISATKRELTILFAGATVRYERKIACKGSLERVAFDAALFSKLAVHYAGEISLEMGNSNELIVKSGTSQVRVPTSAGDYDYGDGEDDIEINVEPDTTKFSGWLKQHPLNHAVSLKKALSSIKDNITKTELVVDVEWGGKSDILKVKIVDQFHGVLAYVKLKEPIKKRVSIRLPLNSFLLLLDITGKMYVDTGKVIIKDDTQSLTCKFIAGSAFGSIEDMVRLIKSAGKEKVTISSKALHDVVKRATSISAADDSLTFTSEKGNLLIDSVTDKASIREMVAVKGKFAKAITLSPKNLQDITSCLTGDVEIFDLGRSLIFKSAKDDIVINAALQQMGG